MAYHLFNINDLPETPPQSGPDTPDVKPGDEENLDYASLTNVPSATARLGSAMPVIPETLTQDIVNADPQLKRFQKDLLILTSFNDNSTLHWRPSWFQQESFSANFWTLYNPPDVVTELLPHPPMGRLVYTRRMRHTSDPPASYIRTWQHWSRVCDLRGIPRDFLCEKQIELMRLGLPRDTAGTIGAPPTYPLYPEPQPSGHGRYILSPSAYRSHLPPKFHNLRTTGPIEDIHIVAVYSNGRLVIEKRGDYFLHSSQWTCFNGKGGYVDDTRYVPDMDAPREQGRGRRWCWLPWTEEMEGSCGGTGLKIRLRGWNSAMVEEGGEEKVKKKDDGDGVRMSKRVRRG